VDILISRGVEILMCFPTFFLILTVIAFVDQRSILNIMLIIGLTGWTGTAMIVRGEIFKQREMDYVAAARALGASRRRIIFRHIVPNAIAPVIVGISFAIAGAIAVESGLSFLGVGVASPTATWGELLMESRDSPLPNWWLSIFPGVAIFLSMTAYNLIGEGLRDAMDPKMRK
jgi:peptide/nickel transport system permease protein